MTEAYSNVPGMLASRELRGGRLKYYDRMNTGSVDVVGVHQTSKNSKKKKKKHSNSKNGIKTPLNQSFDPSYLKLIKKANKMDVKNGNGIVHDTKK